MKDSLWHSVTKRAAPVITCAMVVFSAFDAKANENHQEDKSPEIQMAEQIFDVGSQATFEFLFGGRNCIKDSSFAIKAFKDTQDKAMKSGEDVFKYDNQIFDAKNKNVADEKFKEYYLARCLFKKEYTFQNKKFSTLSNFSTSEQISVYGNLNREITQSKDNISAGLVHGIACQKVRYDIYYGKAGEDLKTKEQKDEIFSKLLIDKLDRYYDLLNICGNPGVYLPGLKLDFISFFTKGDGGIFSPNLLSSGGNIFLTDNKENILIDEMSHAFRNRNNAIGEAGQFVSDGLKDILTFNNLGFTSRAQSLNYSTKGKMEYDAHNVVAPVLKAFIDGRILTVSQVYALIEKRRKEEGYSYAQTTNSKIMAIQGDLEIVSETIEKKGLTDTLQKLQQDLNKQQEKLKKNLYRLNREKRKIRGGRH